MNLRLIMQFYVRVFVCVLELLRAQNPVILNQILIRDKGYADHANVSANRF